MPNRQKLRKERKEQVLRQRRAAQRREPPPRNAVAFSTPVQKVLHGGQLNIEQGIEQLLIESEALRQEPEFRNLHFDVEHTAEVSARLFPKYQQRFKQAEHKNQDETQQIYDDFRIEVIDELATPEFRRDLLQRLERCAARFRRERNQERWETTTLLKALLEQPKMAWGICMLVITMFEEARGKAEQQDEEAMEVLGDYVNLIGRTTDPAEILQLGAEPAQLEVLTRKLDAKPGLRERLERQAHDTLDHFEEDIFQGKYDLHLFSDAETMRAVECFHAYLETNQIEVDSIKAKQVSKPFAECIEQTVREIATPERVHQLVKDLEQTAREWLRQGKPEGSLLQIESHGLADDPSPENYVLYTLFAGQLRRFSKEQSAKANKS